MVIHVRLRAFLVLKADFFLFAQRKWVNWNLMVVHVRLRAFLVLKAYFFLFAQRTGDSCFHASRLMTLVSQRSWVFFFEELTLANRCVSDGWANRSRFALLGFVGIIINNKMKNSVQEQMQICIRINLYFFVIQRGSLIKWA